MRVISGIYKRRILFETTSQTTRSTKDRVKETMFNMLGTDVYDKTVLDLFAGSGALGIEAISRGAKQADFVEVDKEAYSVLNKNLKLLEIEPAHCYFQDAFSFLKQAKEDYQLILLDPPYQTNYLQESLEAIVEKKLLQSQGLVVSLSHKNTPTDVPDALKVVKERVVGITLVRFYEWSE